MVLGTFGPSPCKTTASFYFRFVLYNLWLSTCETTSSLNSNVVLGTFSPSPCETTASLNQMYAPGPSSSAPYKSWINLLYLLHFLFIYFTNCNCRYKLISNYYQLIIYFLLTHLIINYYSFFQLYFNLSHFHLLKLIHNYYWLTYFLSYCLLRYSPLIIYCDGRAVRFQWFRHNLLHCHEN